MRGQQSSKVQHDCLHFDRFEGARPTEHEAESFIVSAARPQGCFA